MTQIPATAGPLSFTQEQLWFIDEFHHGLPAHNVPSLIWLRGHHGRLLWGCPYDVAPRFDLIDRATERGYLLGIAVRVAADARRSHRRLREVPHDDDQALGSDGAASPEELLDQKRARYRRLAPLPTWMVSAEGGSAANRSCR